MKGRILSGLRLLLVLCLFSAIPPQGVEAMNQGQSTAAIKLPAARYDGKMTVESALLARRSVRSYKEEPVAIEEIAQLLWAAQGITGPGGYRTSPSAGALYPLEIYVAAGKVTGLDAGLYKYDPHRHELTKKIGHDVRGELAGAALGQSMIASAPATVVICGVYERTTRKYGERGARYVHMEAGHAGQNISLEAVALNLGAVVVGAFEDDRVQKVLELDVSERPLCLMPVGK